MSDIHIDDFFRDAAIALNRLYLSFPRPIALYVEDIIGPDQQDEFGLHSTRHMACFATLLWLAEERHFRFADTIRQDAVDQAVLSARTFTLLSTADPLNDAPDLDALPAALRFEHASSVQRIREALRSQSSSRIRAIMTNLLRRATSI